MSNTKDNIPPGSVFYLKMLSWNSDDTMGLNAEALTGGTQIKDALDPLKNDIEEHGGFGYVYECRPIFKVTRPDIKIIDMRKSE